MPLDIRLERFINASPMKVWEAIVNPDKFFITFVGIKIVGEYVTGEMISVDEGRALVVEATPGKRLAVRYNYDPEAAKTFVIEESTMVEFLLIEQDGGTLLKFSETDFENLPEAIRQHSFDSVNSGWPGMIHELGDLVERGEGAWLFAQSYGMVMAPVEKVWEAAVNFRVFSHLMKFEGEVKEGNIVILDFGGDGARIPILITNVRENSELAFRWHHDMRPPSDTFDEAETTLVRFQMMTYESGTWVILRESEFDRIPEDKRQDLFEAQVKGWAEGIAELNKKVGGTP